MVILRLRSSCDSRRKKDLPRRWGFRKRLLEAQGQLTSGNFCCSGSWSLMTWVIEIRPIRHPWLLYWSLTWELKGAMVKEVTGLLFWRRNQVFVHLWCGLKFGNYLLVTGNKWWQPQNLLMMINLDCQLDRIWNHLGDTPLGMSGKMLPDRLN